MDFLFSFCVRPVWHQHIRADVPDWPGSGIYVDKNDSFDGKNDNKKT